MAMTVRAHRCETMSRGQSGRLTPMVREAMQAADLRFDQIDRVVVTTGPGSFTGLRVGLSFARVMALAIGKPCLGVSTLEALALEDGRLRFARRHRGDAGARPTSRSTATARQMTRAEERRKAGCGSIARRRQWRRFRAPHQRCADRYGQASRSRAATLRVEELSAASALSARGVARPRRMMMRPKVAPASAEDAAAMAALHAACVRCAVVGGGHLQIAGKPHRFCGSVARRAQPKRLHPRLGAGEEAEILTLAVAPESRRAGIGLALTNAAMANALVRGAREMFLEVAEDNHAARRLYTKLGFAEAGAAARLLSAQWRADGCFVLRRALPRPKV